MRYDEIQTPEQMIEYLVECTLATIEMMACRKTLPKGEFLRQCGIAQKGIKFLGPSYKFSGRLASFPPGDTVESFYTAVHNETLLLMSESKKKK